MTAILFLAVIGLFLMVMDHRDRLRRLERRMREGFVPLEHVQASAVQPATPVEAVPEAIVPEPEPEPVAPAPAVVIDETPREDLLRKVMANAARGPEFLSQEADEIPPAPSHAAEAEEPTSAIRSTSFEDLFGRKLPIWAGGVTLIVAAVLMVKYSIDSGLLSPTVRVIMGLLFGSILIGGAEFARRHADKVQDPRVAQALSGAGLGALYAATLSAANLYHLISPGLAFAGLAAITALAMGLSLRFGVPSAVLGLVGGLATPALVRSDAPNVPMLCAYLAIVIGSLALLSRRQKWFWLGVTALIGGMGWTVVLIALGGLSQVATFSVGALILLLGLALPLFATDDSRAVALRAASGVIAALEIAVLVQQGGYSALTWGLYGLLSLGFVWLSRQEESLRRALVVPLASGLFLTSLWPDPGLMLFTVVMAVIIALFGGVALSRLWRGGTDLLQAGQLAGMALAGDFIANAQFNHGLAGQDTRFALLALVFALVPAAGALLGWKQVANRPSPSFALLAMASGLLVIVAAITGLDEWAEPVAIAGVAAALVMLAGMAKSRLLSIGALVYLVIGTLGLLITGYDYTEMDRLVSAIDVRPVSLPHALIRWTALTAAASLFAWRLRPWLAAMALQAAAALLAYGLIAQVVPWQWLGLSSALAAAACAFAMKQRRELALWPAIGAFAVVALLWALDPLFTWLLAALLSLVGEPLLVTALPNIAPTLRQLIAPTAVVLGALWLERAALPALVQRLAMAVGGVLALIGGHVLYKHLFHVADPAQFLHLGLAERTVWELLLIGAGIALWKLAQRPNAGAVLVLLGTAHSLIYSLLLHNPLFAGQTVGPWPLVNLLIPSFGIAIGAPVLLAAMLPAQTRLIARPGAILQMLVIVLLSYASLRQIFVGSLLTVSGVSQAENIGRSLLAVVLGLAFLGWGIRRGARDWRIASLVLMLGAVGKVFLFDASGLQGLGRIASFLALGFSLIGIGWLYSRYLRPDSASDKGG